MLSLAERTKNIFTIIPCDTVFYIDKKLTEENITREISAMLLTCSLDAINNVLQLASKSSDRTELIMRQCFDRADHY